VDLFNSDFEVLNELNANRLQIARVVLAAGCALELQLGELDLAEEVFIKAVY